jgi:hypothetical protein
MTLPIDPPDFVQFTAVYRAHVETIVVKIRRDFAGDDPDQLDLEISEFLAECDAWLAGALDMLRTVYAMPVQAGESREVH